MSLLIKEIVEDVQYIAEDVLNEEGEKTGAKNLIKSGKYHRSLIQQKKLSE